MSRVGVFRSHNKVGETWSFKVLTWTGKTWTGVIAFEGGNMKLPSQPGTYGGNPKKRILGDSLTEPVSGFMIPKKVSMPVEKNSK